MDALDSYKATQARARQAQYFRVILPIVQELRDRKVAPKDINAQIAWILRRDYNMTEAYRVGDRITKVREAMGL